MPSFHEIQELLLLSHGYGIINDEELLLLYEEYMLNNPDCSYEAASLGPRVGHFFSARFQIKTDEFQQLFLILFPNNLIF
jgi:hypothetical protein